MIFIQLCWQTLLLAMARRDFYGKYTQTILPVYQIGISDNPSVISCHVEDGPAFLKSPISAGKQQPSFTESSEPTTSPFNFERHSNIIQQLTKSPGDGFLFDSRPMFDSSVDEDKEQVCHCCAGVEIFNFSNQPSQ